jgi:hypothetical protein
VFGGGTTFEVLGKNPSLAVPKRVRLTSFALFTVTEEDIRGVKPRKTKPHARTGLSERQHLQQRL